MVVTAVGGVVFALLPLSLLSARAGAVLLGATIPLSASAAVVLDWGGGATVQISAVAVAALIAREGACGLGRSLRDGWSPPPGAYWLLAFLATALAGAFALPRVFAGATLVYPLDRTVAGVTGGVMKFPLAPLAPGAGAVTQSVYLTASVLSFFTIAAIARRDPRAPRALLWAATGAHVAMAAADAMGAGWIDLFRTATYQIAAGQNFAGFTRLTGGATEPSVFGAVAVALAAWHLWSFRISGGLLHALAGAALAALAAASISSTALATLGAICGALLLAMLSDRRPGALAVACFIAAGAVATIGWLALGPYGAAAGRAFDALFIDKWLSESGLERAAWAHQAMVNFTDTYGFGVGLGAARASGWGAAVLGQTGVAGAVLMACFLARLFFARGDGAFLAAAAAALFAAVLSASRVDPGILFFILAGAHGARSTALPIFSSQEATCARYSSTASS